MTLSRREVDARIRRARLLPQRDLLADLLDHLVERAVALYEGESLLRTTPEGARAAAATLDAIEETCRQWVLDLAERGTFSLWGITAAADLVSVPLDIVQMDEQGSIGGTTKRLADWIVTGAAKARGWVDPRDIALPGGPRYS